MKLEAFADRYFIMAQMIRFVLDGVQNFVGKGENAGYQRYLLFPQRIQKASSLVVFNPLPDNKFSTLPN